MSDLLTQLDDLELHLDHMETRVELAVCEEVLAYRETSSGFLIAFLAATLLLFMLPVLVRTTYDCAAIWRREFPPTPPREKDHGSR